MADYLHDAKSNVVRRELMGEESIEFYEHLIHAEKDLEMLLDGSGMMEHSHAAPEHDASPFRHESFGWHLYPGSEGHPCPEGHLPPAPPHHPQ